MEVERSSNGGRTNDVLEIGTNRRGNIVIGDLGLRPREPYHDSKRQIYRAISNFTKRIWAAGRNCQYLVPMGQQEYFEYCQQRDKPKTTS